MRPAGRIALGVGGVALMATGPIGIAVLAGPGLSGAAALTSGLAAFGPGGMVGGLATLGATSATGAGMTTVALTATDPPPPYPFMVVDEDGEPA